MQSGWTSFGYCSVSCGGGTQSRTRSVITKQALSTNAACGPDTDSRPCHTQTCPPVQPGDCVQSGWSNWGNCSKTCGLGDDAGLQNRTRSVITAQNTSLANSTACGADFQNQKCNLVECPQSGDCLQSDWSDGTCSTTCGGGVITTQTRSIITPQSGNGTACGTPTRTVSFPCNTEPCPVGSYSYSSFAGSYSGSYAGSYAGSYSGSFTGSYSYTGSYQQQRRLTEFELFPDEDELEDMHMMDSEWAVLSDEIESEPDNAVPERTQPQQQQQAQKQAQQIPSVLEHLTSDDLLSWPSLNAALMAEQQ